MRKFNLELPKYRLAMHFRLIKRRKPLVEDPILPTVKTVNKKYRKGSFLGRYFRHIFEHKSLKRVLAANFAIIAVTGSLIPQGASVLAQESAETEPVIETQVTLKTEKSVQYPVMPVKITQRFAFFHPGVDFDGLTGDPVKSIKTGRVSAISYSKFAYGNSILVDHGNSLISLYAHLSKIGVEEGQEVTMDTELGKMGATGRAFGRAINPLTILR